MEFDSSKDVIVGCFRGEVKLKYLGVVLYFIMGYMNMIVFWVVSKKFEYDFCNWIWYL